MQVEGFFDFGQVAKYGVAVSLNLGDARSPVLADRASRDGFRGVDHYFFFAAFFGLDDATFS